MEGWVRMILILSHHLFDNDNFAVDDIEIFIDMVKKHWVYSRIPLDLFVDL